MFKIHRGKKKKRTFTLCVATFPFFCPRSSISPNWREEYQTYLNKSLVERNKEFMDVLTIAFSRAHQEGSISIYHPNKVIELEFVKFFRSIYRSFCTALGIPLPAGNVPIDSFEDN